MTQPHLVVGQSGQVGEHLFNSIRASGTWILGTYSSCPVDGACPLDIRDRSQIELLLKSAKPSVVYLPASITNVDYCEANPEESYKTNVDGIYNVLEVANKVGAKLVYFSSDYIFDGKSGPYEEDDITNPICVYGRHKLLAERYITFESDNYLIIRTTGVYGWEKQGKNFVYRLINTLKEGKTIRVPTDQISTPTYAPNLAQVVVELVEKGKSGVYNVAGTQRCSRYEFACEVARIYDLDTSLIYPVSTKELNQSAPRPLEAGLIVDKAREQVDTRLVGYEEGLIAMLGGS